MTSASAVVVSVLTALAVACGGSKSTPAAPQQPANEAHSHGGPGGMGMMCPMHVPGTTVSTEDTQDGVALVFKTTGDVAQLRERVHAMAARHEQMMAHGGMGHGGMGHGGMGHGGHGGMMRMVPALVRAEDIDEGARLVFTPEDPARLAELRGHVREHAHMMAMGHCMMEHHA